MVATLALFIALGSSATAAVVITGHSVKNGSLTGADIKNNSVASADVKDGSLVAKDFNGRPPVGGTGVTGAAGARGATGATGATGGKGDVGATGTKGTDGNTGPAGDTGPRGVTGNDGGAGPTGQRGPTGVSGPTYTAGDGLALDGDVFSVAAGGISTADFASTAKALDADKLDGKDSTAFTPVCPAGYVFDTSLCVQSADTASLTLAAAADTCRQAGARLPTLSELYGIALSSVTLASNLLFDWTSNSISPTQTLYVSAQSGSTLTAAARDNTTVSGAFGRCVIEPHAPYGG